MAADVFQAVSDSTRRAFLDQLAEGERAVSELVPPGAMSQPAVSQHLRVLREAGLVTSTKVGRQQIYALVPGRLKEVSDWVAHYTRFWDEKLNNLEALLDQE